MVAEFSRLHVGRCSEILQSELLPPGDPRVDARARDGLHDQLGAAAGDLRLYGSTEASALGELK